MTGVPRFPRVVPGGLLRIHPLPTAKVGLGVAASLVVKSPSSAPQFPQADVPLLPSGEFQAAWGLPTGEGLTDRIRDVVQQSGGDFAPPPLFRTPTPAQKQALDQQLVVVRPGAERRLIEMPKSAVTHPFWNFLNDARTSWVPGFRWVFDPKIGVPVFINTPHAIENPRGVAVMMHGACGLNSGPHSLVTPASYLNKQGLFAVCAPTPFHAGYGPEGIAHNQMDQHMAWRADILEASGDYFLGGSNGALPRVLIGRSTGGNEALELMKRHPDLIQAAMIFSPYHPEGAEIDGTVLATAQEYGFAQANPQGVLWNSALDPQWTFMGNNTPAFPTHSSLTKADLRTLYEGFLTVPATERRAATRAHLIQQLLPEALRNHPDPLIELTIDVVRTLFPDIQIPDVQSDSILATTTTPTLLYIAGPDFEYLAIDRHHFLTWVLAAAQNPNVKIVLAPRGDHDPFMWGDEESRRASQAFQEYSAKWLDTVIPHTEAQQARSTQEIPYSRKLGVFYHAWTQRNAAGLPTETEIAAIRQTDPAKAQELTTAKQTIIDTVNTAHGVRFTYKDFVEMGERILEGGRLRATDKRVLNAFKQWTESHFTKPEAIAFLQGLTLDQLPELLKRLTGSSPF